MTDEDVTFTEGSGNVFRDLALPFAALHLEEAEKARAADPGFDGRGLCHRVMARLDADLRALLADWRALAVAGEGDLPDAIEALEALLDGSAPAAGAVPAPALRALAGGWRARVAAERMGEAPDGPASGYASGVRGCAADLEALLDG